MHKLQGLEDCTSSFLIIQLLKSIHKANPTTDTRLPIDKFLLEKLIEASAFVTQSVYERAMMAAMFAVAFHAFLRIGEITVRSPKAVNQHLLGLCSIQMGSNYFNIQFLPYKHSQGKCFSLSVKKASGPRFCPFILLQEFLKLWGQVDGPLFCLQSGSPVLRQKFDDLLKKALIFAKVNPRSFKGHSFRIGAATWAAAQGSSELAIKQMGRWKSDAYKKYIRNTYKVSAI